MIDIEKCTEEQLGKLSALIQVGRDFNNVTQSRSVATGHWTLQSPRPAIESLDAVVQVAREAGRYEAALTYLQKAYSGVGTLSPPTWRDLVREALTIAGIFEGNEL